MKFTFTPKQNLKSETLLAETTSKQPEVTIFSNKNPKLTVRSRKVVGNEDDPCLDFGLL